LEQFWGKVKILITRIIFFVSNFQLSVGELRRSVFQFLIFTMPLRLADIRGVVQDSE